MKYAIRTAVVGAALILSAACVSTSGNQDYAQISPTVQDGTMAMIAAKDKAAREQELAVLKQYEQMDYQFFKGDAEAYK